MRKRIKDFKFTKLFDKSSPKLSLACADGTHIDNVIVHLCRAGGDKLKYMEYKLSNCLISNVKAVADGRGFPIEMISINYGKIQWTYTQQKRKGGGAAGNVSAGWNLEKNCKV